MRNSHAMTKVAKPHGEQKPMFYATVTYKLWVKEQLAQRGWTLREFAERLIRADRSANATSGGLSQFLGPENEMPEASNTTLMPVINKVLGASPPPVCDPTNPITQIQDRIAAKWQLMTPNEKKIFNALFGIE